MTLFYENREHVNIGGSFTGITPYGGGWFFSKFKNTHGNKRRVT
jgi:hypothetical protein